MKTVKQCSDEELDKMISQCYPTIWEVVPKLQLEESDQDVALVKYVGDLLDVLPTNFSQWVYTKREILDELGYGLTSTDYGHTRARRLAYVPMQGLAFLLVFHPATGEPGERLFEMVIRRTAGAPAREQVKAPRGRPPASAAGRQAAAAQPAAAPQDVDVPQAVVTKTAPQAQLAQPPTEASLVLYFVDPKKDQEAKLTFVKEDALALWKALLPKLLEEIEKK